MSIKGWNYQPVGEVGNVPGLLWLETTDSLATVCNSTSTGYVNLNNLVYENNLNFGKNTVAFVSTSDNNSTVLSLVATASGNYGSTRPWVYSLTGLPTTFLGNSLGDVFAGSAAGAAGKFISYAGANTGSLVLQATANAGNTATTITNVSQAAARTYTIQDAGGNANFCVATAALVSGNLVSASSTTGTIADGGLVANKVLYGSTASPDVSANVVYFSVACGQAALAAGGSVTLYTSSGAKQYQIISLSIVGGTNFSGNSGDRLGQVTDGTTVYSVIPAAQMQTIPTTGNGGWGATALPYPASALTSKLTAAGASLVFKYTSAGSADYSAGTITISGVLVRVA